MKSLNGYDFGYVNESLVKCKSSRSTYDIDPIKMTCSCPSFKYHTGTQNGMCKHLQMFTELFGMPIKNNIAPIKAKTTKSKKSKHTRKEIESHVFALKETLLILADDIDKYEFCGSYRRGKQEIGDIDLLITRNANSDFPIQSIFEWLTLYRHGSNVLWCGPQKISFENSGVQIDVRVLEPQTWPFALLHYTGSKDHNIKMRKIAKRNGYVLSEYGFNGKTFGITTEEGIFDFLEIPYAKPENR